MTTRTVEDDGRITWVNIYPPAGNFLVGRYYRKAQSGANWQPGEDLSTPHAYSMTLVDQGSGRMREKSLAGSCSTYYYPGGGVDSQVIISGELVRPWNANDDIALYNKLGDKFDDGNFNTPVFAGELGETADMLAGRLRQLAFAGRAARRGNFKKAAKLLGVSPPARNSAGKVRRTDKKSLLTDQQTLTSGWLELRYGWMPVMHDIADLADTISQRDKPRKRRLTAYHYIGKRPKANISCLLSSVSGYGKYSKSITAYIEEILPTTAERLGLYNPAGVMWELLPFSFVADWVVPIGDYLRARSLASRVKGTFVFTTFDRHHYSLSGAGTCPATWCLAAPTLETPAWDIRVSMTRTVSTSMPPVRPPVFRAPNFWRDGPQKRLFDAVSLVREIFGSKTLVRV